VVILRAREAHGHWSLELIDDFRVPDDTYRSAGLQVASSDVDGGNWNDIVVSGESGEANRIHVGSGQAWSLGLDPEDMVLVDTDESLPGGTGLAVAADVFAGGFLA
jgi:hypothetical protein